MEIGSDIPVALRSDPTRIRQILFNLVSNAIKFTDNGEVVVRASGAPRPDGRIDLFMQVVDTGCGIPEERLGNLFDEFTQADASVTRVYGGTGLGLAICARLVDLLGGDIGVDSEFGKGSTFWFRIPVEIGDPTMVPREKEATTSDQVLAVDQKLRVLLAEDNAVNQRIMAVMLTELGHEIVVVENGREAVSKVQSERFDLVLMDIQMPEMDGVTATRMIRGLKTDRSRTPIIALTANAMSGDRDKYLASGFDDYVSKPIDVDLLLSAMERCVLMTAANPYRASDSGPTIASPESCAAPEQSLTNRGEGEAASKADLKQDPREALSKLLRSLPRTPAG